jgi:hypothetical protein
VVVLENSSKVGKTVLRSKDMRVCRMALRFLAWYKNLCTKYVKYIGLGGASLKPDGHIRS